MPPLDLTPEAWAQIRHDYEHSDRLVDDICAEHGISAGTLRDRMRRWGWTRRRPPVPREGPEGAPPAELAALLAGPLPQADGPQAKTATTGLAMGAQGTMQNDSPEDGAAGADEPLDEKAIVLRLQGAVARILPAIESAVATFAVSPMRPREIESGVRTLATLTRTLRELNGLLGRHQANHVNDDDDIPEDIDEFRRQLAYRINAFVASRTGQADEGEACATDAATSP